MQQQRVHPGGARRRCHAEQLRADGRFQFIVPGQQAARDAGSSSAVLKLLPVIDNIERAITYTPEELKDNTWVQGVAGLVKHLEKSLEGLSVARIDAKPGTEFNPDFHEAIQFDESAEGDKEVIADELQAGYTLNGRVIRHAMVKVTRQ